MLDPQTRILLVDDHRDDVQSIHELIEDAIPEAHIDHAQSMETARDQVLESPVDLILLAHGLGTRCGPDLIAKLRRAGHRIPVIVLAHGDDRQSEIAALQAGASDVLLREGLDWPTLERCITRCLARRQGHAEQSGCGQFDIQRVFRQSPKERSLFRAVIDSMSEQVFFKDLEGRYLGCNDAFRSFFALSRSDIAGRTDRDLITECPMLAQRAPSNIERIVLNDNPVRCGERFENAGRRFHLETILTRIVEEDGRPCGVVGISRDVTEQIRLNRRIVNQERRLEAALNASSLGIMEWNADHGGHEYWDARTYEILGLDPDRDKPGIRTLLHLIHPEDREAFLSAVRKAWHLEPEYRLEARIVRPDGESRVVSFRGRTAVENGRAARQIGTLADNTEQRMEKRQVAHDRERLNLAAKAGGLGSWMWRFGSQHIEYDAQHAALTGDPDSRQISLMETIERAHPDDRRELEERFARSAREKVDFAMRFRGVRPDRSDEGVIECVGKVIGDEPDSPKYLVGVSRDVTELVQHQRQLEEARDAAEEAARAKSRFLANMSHEIRTPINAVLGFSQLLKRSAALSPQEQDYVETVYRSGNHLLQLINDVLDISKMEAGMVSVKNTDFELRGLLEGLTRMFSLRLQETAVEMMLEADGVDGVFHADEAKIRQILINLLNNAVKYTPSGRIELAARTEPRPDGRVDALIEVRDTGVGIDGDDLPGIFGEFNQARNAQRGREGTGLGLSICKQYVELLGGQIEAESEPGVGSTFRVRLPITAAIGEGLSRNGDRTVASLAPAHGKPRVLIVDDKTDNRKLVAELLAAVGFQTREACAMREAWSGIIKWPADLVILDMEMSHLNPHQLIGRIQGSGQRRVPVIALAADPDNASGNADACLQRPVTEERLFEVLERVGGFSFVYAGGEPADDTEASGSIAAVSPATAIAVSRAAEAADYDELTRLLGDIREQAPAVGQRLRERLACLDYQGISELFDGDAGARSVDVDQLE